MRLLAFFNRANYFYRIVFGVFFLFIGLAMPRSFFALSLLLLVLAACSSRGEGTSRRDVTALFRLSPDSFEAIVNSPLSLPPLVGDDLRIDNSLTLAAELRASLVGKRPVAVAEEDTALLRLLSVDTNLNDVRYLLVSDVPLPVVLPDDLSAQIIFAGTPDSLARKGNVIDIE
ncbi:MAG: hypothetical protein K0U78_19850 [Actinomycetia bacterium]|nr:hypothetical protein [Actinomycetes bacterium]